MSLSRVNASAVTGTRNRVPHTDVVPFSGLCNECLDGCMAGCEVWKSSFRGREVLYPAQFGKVTAGCIKDYPVDYSHLNIQGTAMGAWGVRPSSDWATFPAVDVTTEVGYMHKVKMKVPIFTGALGSTDIARINWDGMAIGAALAGIIIVIGENVCGMDPDAEIINGRIKRSPELERRVKRFFEFYDGWGDVIVQHNVEDGRLGVPEYAVEKLGVKTIEMKWGQGAKDIGGEVKLMSMERAKQLKDRGYIVFPDPSQKVGMGAWESGAIREFERHSRLGMVNEQEFYDSVEHLRNIGAQRVTLKTGAYRPADLARAFKFCSEAKIDLLTIDGAGGGTGMSPWRMMNEWGIPTIYLEAMAYDMCRKLAEQRRFVPDIAIAGGFSLEDHVFKAIALGAPFVKAVCMGRATMIPGFIGKNIEKALSEDTLPKNLQAFGSNAEQIFVMYGDLKEKLGADKIKKLPLGAIAMYTFCDRIAVGLRQLMAGERKFSLKYLTRDDLVSLTEECTKVTGIPYVMDSDKEEVEKILS
jgi:glutamate synthase domain-containing protein 2